MAEKSMLWAAPTSGDGAAAYTEDETTRLFRLLVGSTPASEGVLYGVDNQLAVSGAGSPVSVATGAAFVYGYFYWNTAAVSVAVPTPSIGTTGHRVVLRADHGAKTVRVALKSSSDGVAAIPALTRSAGVTWEISLATLTITTGGVITVTDARSYCHYASKVSTGMLDDDSVDDTKVGDRVPQIYRRQGGAPTSWWNAGTTDYTPGKVRIQLGSINVDVSGFALVNFPVDFSSAPLAFVSAFDPGKIASANGVSTGSLQVALRNHDGSLTSGVAHWLVIGPE